MYAALVICDKVYAFGMAGTALANMASNHYYEPWSVKPTWHKTWDLEKDLWKRLASNPPGWSVESTDVSIIPGLSHITCPGDAKRVAFKELPQPPSPESFIVRVSLVTFLPFVLYITVGMLTRTGNTSRSIGKADVRVVGALAVYTCFVVSTHVYAQLAARRNGGQVPWDTVAMLMIREAFKGVISAFLFLLESRPQAMLEAGSVDMRSSVSTDDGSDDGEEAGGTTYLWLVAGLRLLPLAAAYALSDFWVGCFARGMQMREYLVWTNVSVVFSALAWTCCFRRCLPAQQWLGLCFLFFGGLLRTFPLERRGPLSLAPAEIWTMVASPLISSFANVANERILKDPVLKKRLGLNCLNLIMYFEGFVVILVSHTFFRTWLGGRYAWEAPLDAPIWVMVVMSAATGLALSRVLAYDEWGTVSKAMAGGARHIADAMLSPLVGSTLFYIVCNVCSSLWVTCSISVFFLPWFTVRKRELVQLQDVHMRLYDAGNE
ncbi:unnamed protein product [Prorocentrum cordatum]|uniref:Solute carrier family 40 protein n=1 Tax=Prorocentrum cordatum TaxID=2364126 RepID=A0ABN9YFC6_9DINO|nr:unnamed protein product [Polarella glacialis]